MKSLCSPLERASIDRPSFSARLFRCLSILLFTLSHGRKTSIVLAANPQQVLWSTDPQWDREQVSPTTYGPDGPWQAVVVGLGNFSHLPFPAVSYVRGDIVQGYKTPLYPTVDPQTTILGSNLGTLYSITGGNASNTAQVDGHNATSAGNFTIGWDYVQIFNKTSSKALFNASILVANAANVAPDLNGVYETHVGTLGIGPSLNCVLPGSTPSFAPNTGSLLDQLKLSDILPSRSFGMHIGSVAQKIPGSLVLGGYDRNRLIGTTGVFSYDFCAFPEIYLIDINLGAASCDSPFPGSTIQNLYKGNGGPQSRGATLVASQYGPQNAAAMLPVPGYPYIDLPHGSCEAIAAQLPVTLNPNLRLYTWNQDDPRFSRITGSSAYLEFIFVDIDSKNISIKVPFRLLNLTLEKPLVDSPAAYFPCRSTDAYDPGYWNLGRAFLQAAFFGISYDQNLAFLAQAPGPGINQTAITTIYPTDTNLTSGSSDSSFISFWQKFWEPVDCSQPHGSPAGSDGNGNSLSNEAIAGISAGSIAFICIMGLIIICWRRYRSRIVPPTSMIALPSELQVDRETAELGGRIFVSLEHINQSEPQELGSTQRQELSGYLPEEMPAR